MYNKISKVSIDIKKILYNKNRKIYKVLQQNIIQTYPLFIFI